MKCDACSSARVLSLTAKSRDSNTVKLGDSSWEGYAPDVPNICKGDYIRTAICLDCGKCQGQFPINQPGLDNSPLKAFLAWAGDNYSAENRLCYWTNSFDLKPTKFSLEKDRVTLRDNEFALWDGKETVAVYDTLSDKVKEHHLTRYYKPDLTDAIRF